MIIGQQSGAQPWKWVCFLQATLSYAVFPLNTLIAGGFLIQIYFTVLYISKDRGPIPRACIVLPTLVPSIIALGVFAASVIVASHDWRYVERESTGARCHLNRHPGPDKMLTAVSLITSTGSTIVVIFEVLVLLLIRRSRHEIHTLSKGLASNKLSPSLVIRVCLINIAIVIGVVVTALHSEETQSTKYAADFSMAIVPLLQCIIYASQEDIIGAWVPCLRRKREENPIPALPHISIDGHSITIRLEE
ncbi:hypothetical protein CPC08DRAFT_713050 [Agrocybe pediades]|nr:hypothetical protein CPC08DRAFT_713050 [Agrocybe pediades]